MRNIYFLKFGDTVKTKTFYSVNKLKKTNVSHLLTLDFKNFPTYT
jgi:hypothetical protein